MKTYQIRITQPGIAPRSLTVLACNGAQAISSILDTLVSGLPSRIVARLA